jgi:hypothetical protein
MSENQEFHEWCQTSTVAMNRQASRKVVALCMELGCYKAAAEVVSGFLDLFTSYSQRINEVISSVGGASESVSFSEHVHPILEAAREEIDYEQRWASAVLSVVRDDYRSALLRAAFKDVGNASSRLLHEVTTAHDRYLEVRAGSLRRDQTAGVTREVARHE